jgi:hypothetical protein
MLQLTTWSAAVACLATLQLTTCASCSWLPDPSWIWLPGQLQLSIWQGCRWLPGQQHFWLPVQLQLITLPGSDDSALADSSCLPDLAVVDYLVSCSWLPDQLQLTTWPKLNLTTWPTAVIYLTRLQVTTWPTAFSDYLSSCSWLLCQALMTARWPTADASRSVIFLSNKLIPLLLHSASSRGVVIASKHFAFFSYRETKHATDKHVS